MAKKKANLKLNVILNAKAKALRDLIWLLAVLLLIAGICIFVWYAVRGSVQLAPEEKQALFRCFDSEKGENPETFGAVSITKEDSSGNIEKSSYSDKCIDEKGLAEYSCGQDDVKFQAYFCENKCDNGVCV